MFGYHLSLGLQALRRDVVITLLIIVAVGVGIGAFVTTLTIFQAMAADPIPGKSTRLVTAQIEYWRVDIPGLNVEEALQDQITYRDAVGLMATRAARRQAAMYATRLALTPDDARTQPFQVDVRATYADFFTMFDVPFQYGSGWNAAQDADRSNVVVISRRLNEELFGGINSRGRSITLDGHIYRIVGVIDRWEPLPRFYDLSSQRYGKAEDVFLPFTRAVQEQMGNSGNMTCSGKVDPGWDGVLRADCVWIQFWAELNNPGDVRRYVEFLEGFSRQQHLVLRKNRAVYARARNVREWLEYQHVVSDDARILVLVSFSFLVVCLLNAMALLLSRIIGRAPEISVRRALGADRDAVFKQHLVETALIGVLGGLMGVALTALGLLAARTLLSRQIQELTHLDLAAIGNAVVLSIVATVLAGMYPIWRAAHVRPAVYLKNP